MQLDALRAVTARMLASLGRSEVILYELIDGDPFLELLPAPRAPAIRTAPPFWRAVARAARSSRA